MLCNRNIYYKENFLWPPDPFYKQKIIKNALPIFC
jgi:hypothetical protein